MLLRSLFFYNFSPLLALGDLYIDQSCRNVHTNKKGLPESGNPFGF